MTFGASVPRRAAAMDGALTAKKITAAAKMVTAGKEIKLKKAFQLSDRETEIAMMVSENFVECRLWE